MAIFFRLALGCMLGMSCACSHQQDVAFCKSLRTETIRPGVETAEDATRKVFGLLRCGYDSSACRLASVIGASLSIKRLSEGDTSGVRMGELMDQLDAVKARYGSYDPE